MSTTETISFAVELAGGAEAGHAGSGGRRSTSDHPSLAPTPSPISAGSRREGVARNAGHVARLRTGCLAQTMSSHGERCESYRSFPARTSRTPPSRSTRWVTPKPTMVQKTLFGTVAESDPALRRWLESSRRPDEGRHNEAGNRSWSVARCRAGPCLRGHCSVFRRPGRISGLNHFGAFGRRVPNGEVPCSWHRGLGGS
jgi:hypothetical protein